MWRNGSTRRAQNPVVGRPWRFKSSHPHQNAPAGARMWPNPKRTRERAVTALKRVQVPPATPTTVDRRSGRSGSTFMGHTDDCLVERTAARGCSRAESALWGRFIPVAGSTPAMPRQVQTSGLPHHGEESPGCRTPSRQVTPAPCERSHGNRDEPSPGNGDQG